MFGFNGGTLTVIGTASSVQQLNFAPGDDDPLPTLANTRLQSALCITTSPTANNCVSPTSTNPIPVAGGSTVPVIPIIFDVDPPPGATPPATESISGSGYFRVNPNNPDQMQRCTLKTDGSINPSDCTIEDYCQRVTGSTVADFHCRVTNISLSETNIIHFDTSRATIALFLNAAPGIVDLQDSSQLLHRYCGPLSNPPGTLPDDGRGCPTQAAPAQFTRLSFFGNQASNSFNFRGEAGEGTAMFIYFPRGNVLISDGATASGSIWTNNLTLNNSSSFTSAAPAANCATASSGFCHILRGSLGGGQGGGSAALFDWVARSPVTTRVY
jgi:hypothetical protein